MLHICPFPLGILVMLDQCYFHTLWWDREYRFRSCYLQTLGCQQTQRQINVQKRLLYRSGTKHTKPGVSVHHIPSLPFEVLDTNPVCVVTSMRETNVLLLNEPIELVNWTQCYSKLLQFTVDVFFDNVLHYRYSNCVLNKYFSQLLTKGRIQMSEYPWKVKFSSSPEKKTP